MKYLDSSGPKAVEPNFRSERELQDAIISTCQGLLSFSGFTNFHVVGFGLDCAFWIGDNRSRWLKLLEIKTFRKTSGRCAIGTAKGGKQVELLLDGNLQGHRSHSELELTSTTIRWVFGDGDRPLGAARFAMIDSVEAQYAASGSVIRTGKYNNFRHGYFADRWVPWSGLVDDLATFLMRPGLQSSFSERSDGPILVDPAREGEAGGLA